MAVAEMLRVEVVYALPATQTLIPLQVPAGTDVRTAIQQSGIRAQHPQIDPDHDRLGIFGRPVTPDTRLADGDRVEIYRPLLADPKQARRQRARSPRTGGRG
jgi:hypothetical protein